MSKKIQLDTATKAELTRRKSSEKSKKLYRRLLYIEMNNEGMTHLKISSILGVCNDTLTDWRALYDAGGLDALWELQYSNQGQYSKLDPYKKEIKELENLVGFNTLKDLQGWLKKEHKVESCISNLFYFCKKNSIYLTRKQG